LEGPEGDRWLDAADRDGIEGVKYRNWRRWHRRAVPGGGGLRRSRTTLGCSAIEEEEEQEREGEEEGEPKRFIVA
jgi:hypothetical protein